MIHSRGVRPFRDDSLVEMKSAAVVRYVIRTGNENVKIDKNFTPFTCVDWTTCDDFESQSLGSYALLADIRYHFLILSALFTNQGMFRRFACVSESFLFRLSSFSDDFPRLASKSPNRMKLKHKQTVIFISLFNRSAAV